MLETSTLIIACSQSCWAFGGRANSKRFARIACVAAVQLEACSVVAGHALRTATKVADMLPGCHLQDTSLQHQEACFFLCQSGEGESAVLTAQLFACAVKTPQSWSH